jgi:hypothetical protein
MIITKNFDYAHQVNEKIKDFLLLAGAILFLNTVGIKYFTFIKELIYCKGFVQHPCTAFFSTPTLGLT